MFRWLLFWGYDSYFESCFGFWFVALAWVWLIFWFVDLGSLNLFNGLFGLVWLFSGVFGFCFWNVEKRLRKGGNGV